MAATKRPKRSVPADHPDRFVTRLRRSRVQMDPGTMATVVTFLDLLQRRYERELAKVKSKSEGIDPTHFAGVRDRFTRLIDSVYQIASDITRPQSVVEYEEAVARTINGPSTDRPELGTPPARSAGVTNEG